MPYVADFMNAQERAIVAERMIERAQEMEREAIAMCERVVGRLRASDSSKLPESDSADGGLASLFEEAADLWREARELRDEAESLRMMRES